MSDASERDLQRDLGRLEGKVDAMATQHADFGAKLDRVVTYIENEKGGQRATSKMRAVLAPLGGAVAGAFTSWFLHKP